MSSTSTRRILSVVLLSLWCASVRAQWLETHIPAGYNPVDVCWHRRTNKIYVVNKGNQQFPDSSVTVIDGATNEVVGSVFVGDFPVSAAASESTDEVFVSVQSTDEVVVIDCAADTVARRFALPTVPGKLIYNPLSHKLYGLGMPFPHDSLRVIDCATGTVLATHHIERSYAAVLDTRDNQLYVGDYLRDEVVVIDGLTDSVTAVIDSVPMLSTMAYSAGAHRVYAGGEDVMLLVEIDAAADTVRERITPQSPVQVLGYDPIGDNLWCICSQHIQVVNCRTHTIRAQFPVDWGGGTAVYNPGTGRMFFDASNPDNQLFAMDCSSFAVTARIPLDVVNVTAACANPTSNRIYLTHGTFYPVTVIRDSGVGAVGEQTAPELPRGAPVPALVRGVLPLTGHGPAGLLDATGRKVMSLLPGRNDVSGLAPGVYFVLTPSPQPSGTAGPGAAPSKGEGAAARARAEGFSVRRVVVLK